MYDEKLIEDSLAFAEEIKAMLEGKKEAQQAAAGQVTPQRAVSQQVPVQPKVSVQASVAPQPQTASRPQATVQQRTVSSQAAVQSQAVMQRTVSQQVPVQPKASVQPSVAPQSQAARPQTAAQPTAQPQAVRSQATQQRVMPAQPQAARPQTAQSTAQPQAVRSQATQQRVMPAQSQTAVQTQPVRLQAVPQRTAQPQSQSVQSQAVPQRTAQPQSQPVQSQAVPQRTVQPQPQAVQPQPTAQPQARPQMAVQPQTAAQPQSQAVTQPQATAQPQPQPVKPQEAVAEPAVSPISDESGQSPSASAEDGNAPDNTFEITIKFNAGSFKKKLGALKKKLAPEPRTLEDVNAAMEENRQLQQERSQQRDGSLGENSVGEHESEGKSLLENGTQIAGKAANVVKKFPSLLKKENPAEAGGEILDAPFGAMDAEIATLEGEPAEESLLASKLEDVKSALPQTTKKASKLLTNVIILLFCVGIAYFLASFVTNYVAHQTTVEGESMEPTLSDGDSVIIQRLTYYFKDPERYDVVVFPVHYDNSAGEKTYYIKRVIGLPGETVQIIDGSVYINGSQLTSDKYAVSDIQESGIAEKPLVLGDNQYFVMGDNRNMSTDSRNSYVGLVNKNDIVGEAWLCTWPLSHFGSIKK